jgi:hypothetical protein
MEKRFIIKNEGEIMKELILKTEMNDHIQKRKCFRCVHLFECQHSETEFLLCDFEKMRYSSPFLLC